MIGIDLEGALEMLDGEIGFAFTRGQDSKIVPGIGQCAGIAGMKLQNALETFASVAGLLLLQVGAAKAIESFGAFRVVLEGLLEIRFCLSEIAAFEKYETKGEIRSEEHTSELQSQ